MLKAMYKQRWLEVNAWGGDEKIHWTANYAPTDLTDL